MSQDYPNLTLTFLLEYKGRFLIVKRLAGEKNFPGFWAFPGGKVEVGETIVDTLYREIKEETGLKLTGQFALLDSYSFKNSVGIAFLLKAGGGKVVANPAEFEQFAWICSVSDLRKLPRIPGIDNHLIAAKKALKKRKWQHLEEIQLSVEKYLNH